MTKRERLAMKKAVVDRLREALALASDLHQDVSDAYEQLPDHLWESERGERMSELADTLEDNHSEIESLIEAYDAIEL